MARNRFRPPIAAVCGPASPSALVHQPDVSAEVDEPYDDMSWLAPQALPWLQAEEKQLA